MEGSSTLSWWLSLEVGCFTLPVHDKSLSYMPCLKGCSFLILQKKMPSAIQKYANPLPTPMFLRPFLSDALFLTHHRNQAKSSDVATLLRENKTAVMRGGSCELRHRWMKGSKIFRRNYSMNLILFYSINFCDFLKSDHFHRIHF